jgi:CRISPR-associated protein Csx17
MSMHLHHLTGCAPAPLAHYLKALGVLRLVAEQADPHARGWWQDEHFCLLTKLDREGLERFFLEDYSPSPLFNPWGARSGYFGGSSEKAAREALNRVESSAMPRLAEFRKAIGVVRETLRELGGAKPDSEEESVELLNELRRRLRGTGVTWLDTVKVLVGDSYRSPALFGTGGNEGSGSYTSAYLAAIVRCVIERVEDRALGLFAGESNLDRDPLLKYSWDGHFGQFVPSGSASAWDLLLAFEGALAFRSNVTLSTSGDRRFLSSPFFFAAQGGGAASSSTYDELVINKGRASPGRGEQWFPLWRTPVGADELQRVIAEGKCANGRSRALRAVDAARSIRRLGAARGLTAFTRYGYFQRNNQATHFAVPLGKVTPDTHPSLRLVDELANWMTNLQRFAREAHAPSRLVRAERGFVDAVLDALLHPDEPARWQSVLAAMVGIEEVQLGGSATRAGPIPPLSYGWLTACDDGSTTWRLAVALGSAAASYDRRGRANDPVRHHWLPLKPGARQYDEREKRLAKVPRVVMTGRDSTTDCIALVERRVLEATASRRLSLVAAPGYAAGLADLAELISGNVDFDCVMTLARALMAVRWRGDAERPRTRYYRGDWPDEAWMAIRLAHLASPLDKDRSTAVDGAIVRRLDSGDASAAVELALRRLRSAGLRPPLVTATTSPERARLWAAALAFPIDSRAARAMASRFAPSTKETL